MTPNQKIRLDLYREFGSKAQEAYNFIFADDIPGNESNRDGVYLIYADGHYEYFTGNNPKEGIVNVGVIMGEHSVAISLSEPDGEYTLTNKRDDVDDRDIFTKGKKVCAEDFDGAENTRYIKQIGTDIPLGKDEYIPSAGEMMLIAMNLTKVNEALQYADGDVIRADWYWTSTSYSSTNAWYIGFLTGNVGSSTKATITYRARPVAAFLPF